MECAGKQGQDLYLPFQMPHLQSRWEQRMAGVFGNCTEYNVGLLSVDRHPKGGEYMLKGVLFPPDDSLAASAEWTPGPVASIP